MKQKSFSKETFARCRNLFMCEQTFFNVLYEIQGFLVFDHACPLGCQL